MPRHLLVRTHLRSDGDALHDHPVALVQAPAGFGKTSLLAQWRREHLENGSAVAWVTAQSHDDTARLLQAFTLAVRQASGRPGFGLNVAEAASAGTLEGVTLWLAEVAQSALDLVLVVDEADRLAPVTGEALAYLLRNAPPNLRVRLAARPDSGLQLHDLIDYGLCAVLGPPQLRLRLDETLMLVRGRFGTRVHPDAAARLHELTEGWPLGLQLALSLMGAAADPGAELQTIAARGGTLRERFVGLLLANLEPRDLDLLIRVAILDPLRPSLCTTVSGDAEAAARLARLVRDTPLFTPAESGDWLRLHAVARDELRIRFSHLPAAEQSACHARAAEGLAAAGLVHDAAAHALAAGQRDMAYDLAERGLYESLMSHGSQGTVLEWLARMPPEEVDRRPRLLLAVAWSLALSERHDEAELHVQRILARPETASSAALRWEGALIQGAAAVWADDPDRFAALHEPWSAAPPPAPATLRRVHANRMAYLSLLQGEPALARLRLQQGGGDDAPLPPGYLGRWGDLIIGLSYLWEGQVLLAQTLLLPSLAQAEAEHGRRSPFSCMLAAVLAAASWERHEPAAAAAALANRLDVLEHRGLPEAVLLAFRTLARMASAEGEEHRALDLLAALDAVGQARRLPRMRLASLADQVRLHARRYRADTCRDIVGRMQALMDSAGAAMGPLWRRSGHLLLQTARGHALVAARAWDQAAEALAAADEQARAVKLGRLHIELTGLRAWALERQGRQALPMLLEAADLARTHGLVRVFDDAHPELGTWAAGALSPAPGRAAGDIAAPAAPAAPALPERSTPSMALTPKERQVLELAARKLSNKEIGLALQVGEETVKWHMKNLFAKLDAGHRKHLVQRARLLGLLV